MCGGPHTLVLGPREMGAHRGGRGQRQPRDHHHDAISQIPAVGWGQPQLRLQGHIHHPNQLAREKTTKNLQKEELVEFSHPLMGIPNSFTLSRPAAGQTWMPWGALKMISRDLIFPQVGACSTPDTSLTAPEVLLSLGLSKHLKHWLLLNFGNVLFFFSKFWSRVINLIFH